MFENPFCFSNHFEFLFKKRLPLPGAQEVFESVSGAHTHPDFFPLEDDITNVFFSTVPGHVLERLKGPRPFDPRKQPLQVFYDPGLYGLDFRPQLFLGGEGKGYFSESFRDQRIVCDRLAQFFSEYLSFPERCYSFDPALGDIIEPFSLHPFICYQVSRKKERHDQDFKLRHRQSIRPFSESPVQVVKRNSFLFPHLVEKLLHQLVPARVNMEYVLVTLLFHETHRFEKTLQEISDCKLGAIIDPQDTCREKIP